MELEESLNEQQNAKVDQLNRLLTEKIGYGFAQEKLSRSLYLLLFTEGCQSVVLGLLLPVLTKQWSLTTAEQGLLITVVYLGVSIGSYLQIYSDYFGRYTFITWDAALQTAFGLFSCICWSYNSFLFARFFYGVGIGICLPLSASYITQISPSYMRATLLAKSRVYWSMGCLCTCLLGWLFLSNDSWRLLLFTICLPGIYAMYEHRHYGKESLRYLWAKKDVQQTYIVMKLMCQLNNKPLIQKAQINEMINQEKGQNHNQVIDIPLKQMFNQKYAASSYRLISSWFTVCFVYYGVMLLLPTILQRVFDRAHMSSNFKYIFIICITIIEVAAFQTSSKLMDHPMLGRKKTVYYGFFIVFAVTLLIFLLGQDNKLGLFIIFAIIKFVITITFMCLYPYTAQIYETLIRGKALGICSMFGRIATTLLGVIGVSAMYWFGGYGLYLLIVILSAVSGYGAYTMPYCTRGQTPAD